MSSTSSAGAEATDEWPVAVREARNAGANETTVGGGAGVEQVSTPLAEEAAKELLLRWANRLRLSLARASSDRT